MAGLVDGEVATHPIATTCPHCGHINTAQTGLTTARRPQDGDVAICYRCTGTAIYARSPWNEVMVRPPTSDEDRELRADPTFRRMRRALRRSRRVA